MWKPGKITRVRSGGRSLASTALALAASVIAGISGSADAGDWKVLTVNGRPALGDAVFVFNADSTLSGSTGCNRFTANGQFTSGWLVIDGPVATTKMACPGDALVAQEQRILSVFEHGFSVTYDPFVETLKLTGRTASVVMVPLAADPSPEQQAITPNAETPSDDTDAAAAPATPAAPVPDVSRPEVPTIFNTAFVAVHGLSGRLNVRAEPSTGAKIVGGARAGALLANKGCEERSDRTWCHVAHIGNGRPQGWAAAEYLKPAPAALRAGESLFDGIGTLPCAPEAGASARCDYGVAHDPDGTAAVVVFLPDGSEQLVVFRDGVLLPGGGVSPGDGPESEANLVGDQVVVTIGSLRLEIPSAVVSYE